MTIYVSLLITNSFDDDDDDDDDHHHHHRHRHRHRHHHCQYASPRIFRTSSRPSAGIFCGASVFFASQQLACIAYGSQYQVFMKSDHLEWTG